MKNQLAIFDLDGTLFDTEDVNYHAYNKALGEAGYSLDYGYFCRECNGRHYRVFLPEILQGDKAVMETVHQRKKALYREFLGKARPNCHLLRMLRLMKAEYYLAVVTTASKGNTLEILEHFNILKQFDLILTQEDVSRTKPDPEGFLKAMEYFQMKPETTVIFEDSQVGLEAAMASGASVQCVKQF